MLVYNVLFKGVDTPESSCKCFGSYAEAENYVMTTIIAQKDRNWTIMSTSGWRSELMPTDYDADFMPIFKEKPHPYLIPNNFTDYRLEDSYGDSYYFVIYVQSILT